MKDKSLKVGFDLDGVLLYNPARIFRPITMTVKSFLKPKSTKKTHFYYPKSKIEIFIWKIVHWSSMFLAKGLSDIKLMKQKDLIRPYIVTSRYDCLKNDFYYWLKKMNAKNIFVGTYHNKDNLQPHIFKENMINKLELDYFFEDNWDIVKHLNIKTKAKIYWISNPLDSNIPYDLKFYSLKDAVLHLKKKITNV
jgi:hypothetical protein